MGEISVKTGNNARNGGKNSLNRLIRCVCGKKIGPDPRNFNQRVSLGRNDLLIRTFPKANEFKGDYNERKSKVNSLPGADSQAELEEKAAKTQKDFLDGKR
ncbi:hypothetical protein LMH56_28445 (plasmid) [Klebsiella pneumoniae subsp. pneumoniae]|nr:hypothetical protein [Klebsiella pneumoniae]UPF97785.1 hypothetical protein LMH56_28445 [Klebsiella pneumoniae subsp. pneumoniae]